MSDDELREFLAKILTGGVHYYELRDSFTNSGTTQPDFPARYASDVADEIDEVVALLESYDIQKRAE